LFYSYMLPSLSCKFMSSFLSMSSLDEAFSNDNANSILAYLSSYTNLSFSYSRST